MIIGIIIALVFLSMPLYGLQIEDGKGSGRRASVSTSNRLDTSARANKRLFYISRDNGQLFSWASGTADIDGGDTALLVKNTATNKNLYIEHIWISSNTETRVIVHLPTTEVIVTGTTIIGINLNTGSSNVAEAAAARDQTNNSQGDIIWSGEIQATSAPLEIEFDGALILAKNRSVGVDILADGSAFDVTIIGHFE